MKHIGQYAGARAMGSAIAALFACVLATAGAQVHAQGVQTLQPGQAVKPPPRTPGTALVKLKGGMDDNEIKREVRAHRHKGQDKKDVTKDDSVGGSDKNNGKGS